ncbi:type III-B CRISPR module RAMP protein Cmr4 [Caminibacter pacificus]|uniref:CRISPR-associated Cmr4 family protein n=1 Tax=Caminibacter pacificus TaxID=1424653 RepID=A0AAJ4RAI0_9BACT|nr:type III-B CRISPR module RAMP protein Cmr4 [Caminibacter pacificus]QCI28745.1 type III-B CRISPR module RAMP protein Cmr4 [Caminibacter pacificus]ROR37190.1 CRISPR-associated Cmr4 family protein [Caminibacter pacificus]
MVVDMYKLQNITNMHVGSGGVNYDIIENQVQKDVVTNLPIIYASSLKGALREHFENKHRGDNFIEFIFGSSPGDEKNNEEENEHKKEKKDEKKQTIPGSLVFFEAFMLTRPVRSNVKPYFNVTSPFIIEKLINYLEEFAILESLQEELKTFYNEIRDVEAVIFENIDDVYLEDYKAEYKQISKIPSIFPENLAILSYENFKNLSLPVVARNRLENGESKNLWYEEIVPKYSNFIFFIGRDNDEYIDKDDKPKIEQFFRSFESEKLYQIGANKTIGFGICKIEKVEG